LQKQATKNANYILQKKLCKQQAEGNFIYFSAAFDFKETIFPERSD